MGERESEGGDVGFKKKGEKLCILLPRRKFPEKEGEKGCHFTPNGKSASALGEKTPSSRTLRQKKKKGPEKNDKTVRSPPQMRGG